MLSSLNGSNDLASTFDKLSKSMQQTVLKSGKLSLEQLNLIKTSNIFKKTASGTYETLSGLTLEEVKNAASTASLSASQSTAAISTSGLSTAFKGLWATMKAHPIMSITAIIGVGIAAFQKYKQSQEEARQATQEAANSTRLELPRTLMTHKKHTIKY